MTHKVSKQLKACWGKWFTQNLLLYRLILSLAVICTAIDRNMLCYSACSGVCYLSRVVYRQVSATDKEVNQPAQWVRADVEYRARCSTREFSRQWREVAQLSALVQVVRSAYHYEWIATSLARASNWFDHRSAFDHSSTSFVERVTDTDCSTDTISNSDVLHPPSVLSALNQYE
jgi:hypothetical protein